MGSQFKKYPADKPRRYNGCGEPCDMWIGPCCCGAWHNGADHEEWLARETTKVRGNKGSDKET